MPDHLPNLVRPLDRVGLRGDVDFAVWRALWKEYRIKGPCERLATKSGNEVFHAEKGSSERFKQLKSSRDEIEDNH